jgi:hypothetical protein
MSWYRVAFADKYTSALTAAQMIEEFSMLPLAAGSRKGAGLFRGSGSDEAVYYFSPGAAAIAMSIIERYSGKKCEAPFLSEVTNSGIGRIG